jgi:hypothetical protein
MKILFLSSMEDQFMKPTYGNVMIHKKDNRSLA